jgi:hypothetical protein
MRYHAPKTGRNGEHSKQSLSRQVAASQIATSVLDSVPATVWQEETKTSLPLDTVPAIARSTDRSRDLTSSCSSQARREVESRDLETASEEGRDLDTASEEGREKLETSCTSSSRADR